MRRQAGLQVVAVAIGVAASCGVGQGIAFAQVKPIVAETYHNTFSRAHAPLARIRPGETIATKTIDASGRDETGTVRRRPPSNPLTGPFYVEGAEPGDALVVRFTQGQDESQLGLERLPARTVFADAGIDRRASIRTATRPTNLIRRARERRAVGSRPRAADRPAARADERCHQAGVSGEADARMRRRRACGRLRADVRARQDPTAATSTTTKSAKARRSSCPSTIPARCLFIGDGHALQADGEPTGTGVETSMDVEFTVERAQEGEPDRAACRNQRTHHQHRQPARVRAARLNRATADGHERHGELADVRSTRWSRGRPIC